MALDNIGDFETVLSSEVFKNRLLEEYNKKLSKLMMCSDIPRKLSVFVHYFWNYINVKIVNKEYKLIKEEYENIKKAMDIYMESDEIYKKLAKLKNNGKLAASTLKKLDEFKHLLSK